MKSFLIFATLVVSAACAHDVDNPKPKLNCTLQCKFILFYASNFNPLFAADYKPQAARCPAGSASYNSESCLLLQTVQTSFRDGLSVCKKLNGNPVMVDSKAQQSKIESYVFFENAPTHNIWLGGARMSPLSDLFWINGGQSSTNSYSYPPQGPYGNWGVDEPNNDTEGAMCLEMVTNASENVALGKWRLVDCNRQNQVLCEIKQEGNNYGAVVGLVCH